MSELVRTLGKEKKKTLDDNIDFIMDKYRNKANELGYKGELRFRKEKGKIVISVVINEIV